MAGEKQIAPVKEIGGSYSASPMQEGTRFHSVSSPHSGVDIEQIISTLLAALNVAAFRKASEQRQLPVEWNDTETDFPRDKCVHELFETQVERTPNAVALVNSKGAVSYRELDYQANRVAIHLRSLSVGPGVPIGICVQRPADMAVGLPGIIKAGGAYLPPDPGYPRERMASMPAGSGAPVLLNQKTLAGHFQFQIPNCREVCLDSRRRTPGKEGRASAPRAKGSADNLARGISSSNASVEKAGRD